MRFDSYHPVINLIYFAAAIVCTIWFHHPVFLGISYVCAFVYSVKLNGKRAVIFNLCLIPLIFLYAAWYSYYNHFGVTNLRQNFIGNQITLESVVYGIVRGTTVAAVIMFFSCVFAVVSSDKVVYLSGDEVTAKDIAQIVVVSVHTFAVCPESEGTCQED